MDKTGGAAGTRTENPPANCFYPVISPLKQHMNGSKACVNCYYPTLSSCVLTINERSFDRILTKLYSKGRYNAHLLRRTSLRYYNFSQ
uniref:40S ribosomal protein S25 n=1 Tax=Steinernema glaseri TaxID=37863 RepID=A0A1I8A3V9_9BILA